MNKYFENIPLAQFDYFKKYPERRRIAIVSDETYAIKIKTKKAKSNEEKAKIKEQKKQSKIAFSEMMYDAGKLNAFIKVVNDKLFINNSTCIKKVKRPTPLGYKTQQFTYNPSEYLFNKLFLRGTFCAIEVFKSIIRLGIDSHGIKKIIFSAMPKDLKVENYSQEIPNAKHFKFGTGEYSVVLSSENEIIYVAMFQHLMAYE